MLCNALKTDLINEWLRKSKIYLLWWEGFGETVVGSTKVTVTALDIRFKIRNNTKTLILGFRSLVLHENIIS